MASKLWRQARSQVELLRKQFLPASFNPLGSYKKPQLVQAHARAFLLLTHAEIEWYLEASAKSIARASETTWIASGRVTPPLTHLMASLGTIQSLPEAPTSSKTLDLPARLLGSIPALYTKFYKLVKDNHGVKEQNVLDMFAPLGLTLSSINTTLFPNLSSYGERRGGHAHQSAKAVVSVLDPQTEYDAATNVLNDLLSLDAWIVHCQSRIR